MPISHPLKTIFVHIPKTGGTSIEKALDIIGEWPKWNESILWGPVRKRGKKFTAHHLTISQMCENEFISPIVYKEYFSFCFVRNPWERAVSDFSWMVKMKKYQISFLSICPFFIQKIAIHLPLLRTRCFVDFLKFAKKTREENKKWIADHFWPQTKYFLDCNGKQIVDFIGRFENIEDDFLKVTKKIGKPYTKLPHIQKTRHINYRKYYNKEAKELFLNMYHDDIKYLGYSF